MLRIAARKASADLLRRCVSVRTDLDALREEEAFVRISFDIGERKPRPVYGVAELRAPDLGRLLVLEAISDFAQPHCKHASPPGGGGL